MGHYKGRELTLVGKVRVGFMPALRASVFKEFHGHEPSMPIPELARVTSRASEEKGRPPQRWRSVWLKPQLAASIEYLEWTGANHLRHPKFAQSYQRIRRSEPLRAWRPCGQ
jgi:ATP-dependent DNA ligase